MYGNNTEEGFYDTPMNDAATASDGLYDIPINDAAGANSDGLYEAPREIAECSTRSSVVKNKYAVSYNPGRSNSTPNHKDREANIPQETYGVLNKNRTNENERGTLEAQNNVQESKDSRNNEKTSGKCLESKRLSMTIRRLSNILLVVLVVGLVATSVMLFHVQKDLNKHTKITARQTEETERLLNDAKKLYASVDNTLKVIVRNVSKATIESARTAKDMKNLTKKLTNEVFEIRKTSNETNKKITSVEHKVMKVKEAVKEVAKNTSYTFTESEKRVDALARTITKNISDVRNASTENHRKISEMKNKYGNEIERMEKKSNELNETVYQMRLYGQFQGQFKGLLGMTFKDVVRLTNQTDSVSEDMTPMKKLKYKFDQFKSYNDTWEINYNDVTRLSTDIDFKVSEDVPILLKIDYMHKKFTDKKWGITFSDLIVLTNEIDFKVDGDILLIKELDTMFDGFEDIWGTGTFKGLIKVMKNLTEEGKKGIKQSVASIKQTGRLRFVPGPTATPTDIVSTFGEEDGKVYVTGFVKVKIGIEWLPIYYCYYVDGAYYYFGDPDAIVTCKTGGYSTGKFIEKKNSKKDPYLNYLEIKCTGTEDDVTNCKHRIHNSNHYLTNEKVKCHF